MLDGNVRDQIRALFIAHPELVQSEIKIIKEEYKGNETNRILIYLHEKTKTSDPIDYTMLLHKFLNGIVNGIAKVHIGANVDVSLIHDLSSLPFNVSLKRDKPATNSDEAAEDTKNPPIAALQITCPVFAQNSAMHQVAYNAEGQGLIIELSEILKSEQIRVERLVKSPTPVSFGNTNFKYFKAIRGGIETGFNYYSSYKSKR